MGEQAHDFYGRGEPRRITVAIMFVLLICDFVTGRSIHGACRSESVEITSHRASVVVGSEYEDPAARRQRDHNRQRDSHPGRPHGRNLSWLRTT